MHFVSSVLNLYVRQSQQGPNTNTTLSEGIMTLNQWPALVADGNGALAGGSPAFGPEQQQQQHGEAGQKPDPREELELARKREAAEAVFSALWKAQEAAQAAAEASGEGSADLDVQRRRVFAWGMAPGTYPGATLQPEHCAIWVIQCIVCMLEKASLKLRSLSDPAGELETALKRAESFGRDSGSSNGGEEGPTARAAAGAVSWANSEFAQEEQKGTGTMKIFRGGAKGGVACKVPQQVQVLMACVYHCGLVN